ncbi:MAG: enoyl-CoA hydratase/isomerase family protein [Myxococcota bacterium]|nr:enoyl-CoA hydratase/isomerase family protein [Myxococcota bacterium]
MLPPVWSVDEALDRLSAPYASEDFSALTGEPAFCVDFGRARAEASADQLSAAGRSLWRLPCPALALCAEPPAGALGDWAARFDVVVGGRDDLEEIVAMARQHPLASMSLVQLLRQGESLDVPQALLAESWVYSTLQSGPEFAAWRAARGAPPGLAPHSEPAVQVERWGRSLALTLNRPEKHNAFSTAIRDALVEALRPALVDPALDEIVVRGRGPSFCSGGDLDEFGTLPDPATAHAVRSTRNAALLIHDLADRIRFEVHGACIGAGVELPAFSRRVEAREDAFFQLPELQLGLVPGAGGTASVPRRIGRQRTAWLALTGRRIDAPTAQQWGLVDEVLLSRADA